jgi:hypothetical protein
MFSIATCIIFEVIILAINYFSGSYNSTADSVNVYLFWFGKIFYIIFLYIIIIMILFFD